MDPSIRHLDRQKPVQTGLNRFNRFKMVTFGVVFLLNFELRCSVFAVQRIALFFVPYKAPLVTFIG